MRINYEDSLEARSYRDYKGKRTCKKYRDIGKGLELVKETGIANQRKVAHAEMHSSYETAGAYDTQYLIDLAKAFLTKTMDGLSS